MADNVLLNDGDIATRLRVSKSWVRGQRFKRNHELPHLLAIDPVFIGKCPRYRAAEFEAWFNGLSGRRAAGNCNDDSAENQVSVPE